MSRPRNQPRLLVSELDAVFPDLLCPLMSVYWPSTLYCLCADILLPLVCKNWPSTPYCVCADILQVPGLKQTLAVMILHTLVICCFIEIDVYR